MIDEVLLSKSHKVNEIELGSFEQQGLITLLDNLSANLHLLFDRILLDFEPLLVVLHFLSTICHWSSEQAYCFLLLLFELIHHGFVFLNTKRSILSSNLSFHFVILEIINLLFTRASVFICVLILAARSFYSWRAISKVFFFKYSMLIYALS